MSQNGILGRRNWFDLVVSGIDVPSLRWGLRNYVNVDFVDQLPLGIQPGIVITPQSQGTNLGLASPYTGQALSWGKSVNWSLLNPSEWVSWLFYRSLPTQSGVELSQNIILWLRSDLFPGAAKTSRPIHKGKMIIRRMLDNMPLPQIIAIDGPSASGKSTIAEVMARELGYLFFDTGLTNPAVTLAALQRLNFRRKRKFGVRISLSDRD